MNQNPKDPKIGVYLGSENDPTENAEKELISWGDRLSEYDLEAFGNAQLPTAAQKYYTTVQTKPRSYSNPFKKNLVTYLDAHEYIEKHSPDVLIQLWKYNSHAPGIAVAGQRTGIPVLTRFMGATFESYRGYQGVERIGVYLLNNILGKYIPLSLSDKTIVFGPHARALVTAPWFSRTEPVVLPPDPGQEDRFHAVTDTPERKAALGLQADKQVALYVGRISKLKGMEFLTEVIERVTARTDMLFVLIGEGGYQEHFERRFDDDTVRAVGHVPYQEIDQYYKAADLYIHPSQYEGIPLVILEALECDLPIVAREAGDIRFVTDNIVETPDEMADLIHSENWSSEWKNREYFTDAYQRDTLTTVIEELLD